MLSANALAIVPQTSALAGKDGRLKWQEEAARRREADEDAALSKAAHALQQKESEEELRRARAAHAAACETLSPEELAGSLPLTFRDGCSKEVYTVRFQTKPLCIDFYDGSSPLKVSSAFGAAKRMGVSEGSELRGVARADVQTLGFARALEALKEKIAPLRPHGLEIGFRDKSGRPQPIIFPTQPLGMDLADDGAQPFKIAKVHGVAKSLGVEVDWELTTIDSTDVEAMDFGEMVVLLLTKVESLSSMD